jgi:hypothetical protein
MTFFSYEKLLELEAVRPTTNFALARRGLEPYWATALNTEVILKCQQGDQARTVRLTGQAVRDWLGAPFARTCDDLCPYGPKPRSESLCVRRQGLVGRNVLTENALVLILDGIRRQTKLGGG